MPAPLVERHGKLFGNSSELSLLLATAGCGEILRHGRSTQHWAYSSSSFVA
jgi:hypothetical protein